MKRTRRPLIIFVGAGALIALLSIGLLLDLRAHGAVWRFLYSVTGEEGAVGQLYGFVNYLGNFTRRPSTTQPENAVQPAVDNPIGVNTFLQSEVEPAKRERQVQMIADAGIGWIRQEFTWQDIEIHGRGDFTDRRNDLNGDGTPDTVDAWAKYDNIVALAEQYKVGIIARLGTPPAWSQPEALAGTMAPPADLQDFASYAGAVAERYKGRVRFYQVWNEPNLGFEWGNQPVNPETYTDLLCRAYRVIKAADPANIVISGALSPTIDLSGYNLNTFVYLQRMYDAGAGACFDILGAQGYGLFSGPTDQRMRITTINYAYPVWLRDMMIANGDAHKPVWVSEMAWNPVPNSPDIQDLLRYGQVSDEQAAQYAVEAYERARKDWPWMGVICYWFFKRADDSERNQSWYYFRMVDPDFTPRPVYNAIKDYAATRKANGR